MAKRKSRDAMEKAAAEYAEVLVDASAVERKSRSSAKRDGDIYYFTGKACVNGHIDMRQTSSGSCVQCSKDIACREDQKAKRIDYGKRHYAANRDKVLLRGEKYRKNNREKFAQWMAEWRARNPQRSNEIRRASQSRRRAGLRGVKPSVLADWIRGRNKTCYWCGIKCAEKYHVDHYQPLSKGGKHEIENLVIACPPCNLTKNAKDPYEFAQSMGKLF